MTESEQRSLWEMPAPRHIPRSTGICVTLGGLYTQVSLVFSMLALRTVGTVIYAESQSGDLEPNVWWLLLIPLVLLGVSAFAVGRGRRRLRLLQKGVPADAQVVDKQNTLMKVGERRVYKISFKYPVHGRARQRSSVNTTHPDDVQVGEIRRVLYDRDKPTSTLVEGFAGRRIYVLADGSIQTKPLEALLYLATPLVFLLWSPV